MAPFKRIWQLKKGIVLATLTCGWLLLGAFNQTASAAPALQVGTGSNSFGDPGDAAPSFTLSGINFVETGSNIYQSTYSESQGDTNLTSNKLLPVILIVAVGAGSLIFIAGVTIAGVITWSFLKKRPAASRARTEPPATETVSVWQPAGQQAHRQGAFNRQPGRQVRQSRNRLAQLKAQQKIARSRRHKKLIEGYINVDLAETEMPTAFGHGCSRGSSGLAYVKSGADFVIEPFTDVNPGTGKLIPAGYKTGAGIVEGLGGNMQDPGNWFRHLPRGTVRGLLDAGTDRLKSGRINGLTPRLREDMILCGARLNHDPLHLPSFLELPGRPAALQRGIFNTTLTRSTDQVNPVIWGRDALKNLIGR